MNMNIVAGIVLSAALSLASTASLADMARGEKLHAAHCAGCHASQFGNNGDEIYTRTDRRVTTLAGLKKQVNRCKDMLGFTWFDDEVDDVVTYLNTNHYKFPTE